MIRPLNYSVHHNFVRVGRYHRVHRVATDTFLLTFHHDGKISLGWWGWGGVHAHPPFSISTINYKVVLYTPAERADTLPLFLLYP
jgi:hypothetical protein